MKKKEKIIISLTLVCMILTVIVGLIYAYWTKTAVSHFDTSNVTNMQSMFQSCAYKSEDFILDISNFDTSKVTNMTSMLNTCRRIKGTLTIKNNVTNYNNMFAYAALSADSNLLINYKIEYSSLVDSMLNTKSTNSKITKAASPIAENVND